MSFAQTTTSPRGMFNPATSSRLLLGAAVLLGVLGLGLIATGSKLPALACLAAAGGLVLIVKPDMATLLVTLVLYTNAAAVATQFHGIPKAAAAGVFLLLAVPLYHYVVVQRRQIIIAPAVPLLVLFAVIQLASMLLAHRSEVAGAVVLTTISEGVILYLLVTNVIRDKVVLRRVMWMLLLAGSFLGTLSIVQQLTGDFSNTFGGFAQVPIDELAENPYLFKEPPRAAGPIGEKNYYAQYLLLLLPIGLTFALTQRRGMWRLAAAAAAAIIALAIAFTASRGAVLSGLVMVGAMAALGQIRLRHVALLTVAAALITLASPQLRTRALTMIDLANFAQGEADLKQVDKSTQGRFSEMYAAALIFADRPLQGVGPGNFPSQFVKKADALGIQVHAEERMAHCAILEIAAENGLFGVLCIVAILAVSVRQSLRARRSAGDPELRAMTTAFLVVLIVLMASSFFLSFAYVRYYWFLLALAAAAARLAAESAVDSPELLQQG